jgi:hypothetical protein
MSSNPLHHSRSSDSDLSDLLEAEALLTALEEEKRTYLADWKARSEQAKTSKGVALRRLRGEPEPRQPEPRQLSLIPGTGEVGR